MDRWERNPVIYEINTAVWIHDLSVQAGIPVNLGNVPEATWDSLTATNPDAVWFMGVWKRSPAGRDVALQNPGNLSDFTRALPDFSPDDTSGSPYCVADYTVDEMFGGEEGLAKARNELARRGIRLILDFVPNHLAPDHPWVRKYPEFFIRGGEEDLQKDPVTFCRLPAGIFACGKDPYYSAWQDVIQVNAFHPGYRDAVTETLREIALKCDGVRCDMAMLVVNKIFQATWGVKAGPFPDGDFWKMVIPAVKAICPEFLFIAEVYWDMEWELQQEGFDYCYDKRLYDRLRDAGAPEIIAHLRADARYQERLIRFIENHDEHRAAASFPGEQAKAAAIAALTLPGAKLLYEGQFSGYQVKLPVFLNRRPPETGNEDIRMFYTRLLKILNNPTFRYGAWELCDTFGWPDNHNYQHLLAWRWHGDSDCFLVIINYRNEESQGLIRFIPSSNEVTEWFFDDLFTGSRYVRSREELYAQGLYAGLPGWGFHLFRISAG